MQRNTPTKMGGDGIVSSAVPLLPLRPNEHLVVTSAQPTTIMLLLLLVQFQMFCNSVCDRKQR
jgi:hypothetical protein